jgi:hypothetical protein
MSARGPLARCDEEVNEDDDLAGSPRHFIGATSPSVCSMITG